jgi:thioredoxin 1
MKKTKVQMKNKNNGFIGLMVILTLVVGSSGCMRSNKSKPEAGPDSKVNIEYADNMNSFNELISGNKPVLVDFYADWCAPCRMMSPILEQVARDMNNDVKVVKVNVDKNREAATKYGVRTIPTLMLFKEGEVKWQGVGVMQADQIEQIIKSKSNI